MGRLWRAYLPCAAELAEADFLLDRDESHHLLKVLRLHKGDRFAVFDGAGREWSATLLGSSAGQVRARLDDEIHEPGAEAGVAIRLFQALGRPERIDWLIQKAVEVGVAEFTLIQTSRADAPPVTARRLERWERIAIEACKQSGRRSVPTIETPDVGQAWPKAPPTRVTAILLDTSPGALPMSQCLEPTAEAVWVAVGPAAGFDAAERAAALDLGWRAAGLGVRTLRSETAGVIAAALILHRAGELG